MAKTISKVARSKPKGKMAPALPNMLKAGTPGDIFSKPAHKTPDRKTKEQREAEAAKLAARKHRESVAEATVKNRPRMAKVTDEKIDPGQLALEIEGFLVGQHVDTVPNWPVIQAALARCAKNIQYGWTRFLEKCDE